MESAQSLEPYIAVDDGVGERGEELEEEMAHGASGESGSVSKAPTSQEEPGPGPGPAILNELLPSAARSPSSISPLVSTNSHPEPIPSPAPPPRDAIATTEAPAPSQNSDTEHLRPDPVPQQHSQDTMADNQVKEGDQVAWNWSGSKPGGTVSEVKEQGKVEMETKNNNVVSKEADGPENPALKIERSGHDVVKKASEVEVEKAGDKHKEDQGKEKEVGEKKENGDAETGDKRKAEETAEEKKTEEAGDAKKQKTAEPKENGDAAPKKKGRPAKAAANGAPKKETKKKEPKKAATETGEPRRSARNRS